MLIDGQVCAIRKLSANLVFVDLCRPIEETLNEDSTHIQGGARRAFTEESTLEGNARNSCWTIDGELCPENGVEMVLKTINLGKEKVR